MTSGSPPSTIRELAPEVAEARGAIRECIAGLQNLDQLIRSIQVGPKALERAIPDVYSACEPCLRAAKTLDEKLEQNLGEEGVAPLRSEFWPALTAVMTALDESQGVPMNARYRLRLEQNLRRHLPALDAGIGVFELLSDAVWSPSVPLPLKDVLETHRHPRPGSSLRATFVAGGPHVEVDLPPALLHGILGALVSEFLQRHGTAPYLRLTYDDSCEITLTKEPDIGTRLSWPEARPPYSATQVAQTAAAARGGEIQLTDPLVFRLPNTLCQAAPRS